MLPDVIFVTPGGCEYEPSSSLGPGMTGNIGTGNTGTGNTGNTGNTGTGNTGNTGNTGTGNTGNTGTGNTGNTGMGNTGTGNTGTGNTGTAALGSVNAAQVAGQPGAAAAQAVLQQYFEGIDSNLWASALATFTPSLRASDFPSGASALAKADGSTEDTQVTITSLQPGTGGSVVADVTFQSMQDAADGPVPGQTCTEWDLAYHLVPQGSGLAINNVTPIGSGHTACPGGNSG